MVAVDNSASGAIYKGLAIAGDRLYAADFHNGRVDVYDGSWTHITTPGAFVDSKIPADALQDMIRTADITSGRFVSLDGD